MQQPYFVDMNNIDFYKLTLREITERIFPGIFEVQDSYNYDKLYIDFF